MRIIFTATPTPNSVGGSSDVGMPGSCLSDIQSSVHSRRLLGERNVEVTKAGLLLGNYTPFHICLLKDELVLFQHSIYEQPAPQQKKRDNNWVPPAAGWFSNGDPRVRRVIALAMRRQSHQFAGAYRNSFQA